MSSILIKDPYLESNNKNRSSSTYLPPKNNDLKPFNANQVNYSQKSPLTSHPTNIYQPIQKPQTQQHFGMRQFRSASEAFPHKNIRLPHNIISYQNPYQNNQNIQIKMKNYELNTRLSDLNYEKGLLTRKHQEQILRQTYDKDLIMRKYQEQNEQILDLKRSVSQLLDQKARLESEVDHLMFLMQKDSHQGSLEIKQQLIRMENMERTLKNVIQTKDEQILHLRHRLKLYEDENRRLSDLNKTLLITGKNDKIDNLSKIDHMDSNFKSHNKQNFNSSNMAKIDDVWKSQLKQQKQINQKLMSEINEMKKKLFEVNEQMLKKTQSFNGSQLKEINIRSQLDQMGKIRTEINQEIYGLFCNSVQQGERKKTNSLLIFIENWKLSKVTNLEQKIGKYFKLREKLSQVKKKKQLSHGLKQKIGVELPNKLNSRTHNQFSQWILSTIQFTKNQRKRDNDSPNKFENQEGKGRMQASLLYLFRLLTVQYRAKNPIQGQISVIDEDVNNQLLHSIVKALHQVLEL